MRGRVCGPAKPEERDGDQPGQEDEVGKPRFGLWASELLDVVLIDGVDVGGTSGCYHHAQSDSEKGETGHSYTPVSGDGEYNGVGSKICEFNQIKDKRIRVLIDY